MGKVDAGLFRNQCISLFIVWMGETTSPQVSFRVQSQAIFQNKRGNKLLACVCSCLTFFNEFKLRNFSQYLIIAWNLYHYFLFNKFEDNPRMRNSAWMWILTIESRRGEQSREHSGWGWPFKQYRKSFKTLKTKFPLLLWVWASHSHSRTKTRCKYLDHCNLIWIRIGAERGHAPNRLGPWLFLNVLQKRNAVIGIFNSRNTIDTTDD